MPFIGEYNMKYILTTLALLFFIFVQAQTRVETKNFIAADNITATISGKYIAKASGYADYTITVPTGGTYTFNLQLLNNVGPATTVSIKDPTTNTVLGTSPVPVNANWLTIPVNITLTTAAQSIRLWFAHDVTMGYFTYALVTPQYVSRPAIDSANISISNLTYNLNALKNSTAKQGSIDSLKSNFQSYTSTFSAMIYGLSKSIDSLKKSQSVSTISVSTSYIDSVTNAKMQSAFSSIAALKAQLDTTFVSMDGRVFSLLPDGRTLTIPQLLQQRDSITITIPVLKK